MNPPAAIAAAAARLRRWLFDDALPLWWRSGADPAGGYHDRLALDGRPLIGGKRARVQARQVVSYHQAGAMGWRGPWREAADHGFAHLERAHRRPDGLYCAWTRKGTADLADGEEVDLYDQAFVLLSLASLRANGDPRAETAAGALLRRLPGEPSGGFRDLDGGSLRTNPNMHLFEALLAWSPAGDAWLSRADAQARLALERLIEPTTGVIAELYGPGWSPLAPADAGRVEPGHLFEWAWLLMRWSLLAGDDDGSAAALRLIEVGEVAGFEAARGVAIDALDRELRPIERGARLWPQTERLRAALLAARITGEADYWRMAQSAITTIERYLATPITGMWWDSLGEDGRFVVEPAKASSLYHLVGAITELDETGRVLA